MGNEAVNRFTRVNQARAKIREKQQPPASNPKTVTGGRHDSTTAALKVASDASRRGENSPKTVAPVTVAPKTPRSPSGLALDARTVQAKAAADATRKPSSIDTPVARPSEATIAAISEQWRASHPEFYPCEFNFISMRNLCDMNVRQNKVPFGIELLNTAFAWLKANDHYLPDPSVPRKRGEVVSSAAPTVFEWDPPEKIAARQEFHTLFAQTEDAAAGERAKDMPLEDLQKEIRSSRRLNRQQNDMVVL
jgi:hypothetical protein